MKKIISALLSVIVLCLSISCCFVSFAQGVSINDGKDALVAEWQKGDEYGLDYRYYSPVKSQTDDTKYPLVVLLHGKYSGSYEGEQLTATDFYNWSSTEYQSRFSDVGGAFIILPRTPGGDSTTWNNSSCQDDLMKLINDFIARNEDSIDKSRIYLGGWSMGGAGAITLASENADFFAAAVIMAPFDSVTQSQVDNLKNTPVWLVTCTKDTTASYVMFAEPFWNKLKEATNIPSFCRITTFSKYNYYDAGHHGVHRAVAFDLLNQPSDCGMQTKTAKGTTIETSETESIITWLSSQRLGEAKESDACHCDCHSNNIFTKLSWWFRSIFYRILQPSKKYCECGEKHW